MLLSAMSELQLQTRTAEESRARSRSDFRVSDASTWCHPRVRTSRKTIRQHRQQCQSADSIRSKTMTVAGCARLHASIRVAASD